MATTNSMTLNRARKKDTLSIWSLGTFVVFVLFGLNLFLHSIPMSLGAIFLLLGTATGIQITFKKAKSTNAFEIQMGLPLILASLIFVTIFPLFFPFFFFILVIFGLLSSPRSIGILILFSMLLIGINVVYGNMNLAIGITSSVFVILFSSAASLLSRTVKFKKRWMQTEKEQEVDKIIREAKELHLHTLSSPTTSREITRNVIDRHAIRAINQSAFLSLSMLKTGLRCHSVVLLWLDISQQNFRIKELISDSDNIIEGDFPAAKGVVGGITRRRESLKLENIRDGFRGIPYYRSAAKIKSFIGIPILEHGHLRGVLCADRILDEAFSESDLEILQEASDYIIRTIENERLFSEIEKSKYELSRFFDASRKLNTVLTTQDALATTLECIEDIVPFEFAAITQTLSNDEHEIVAASGALKENIGNRFYDNNGLVSMVTRNKHYLPYGGKVRDGKTLVFSKEISVPKSKSLLVLPLIAQDKVVGTLSVGHSTAGAYTSERREMLEVVANQAAITFANAKMYEQMRELATTDGLTGLANHRTFQSKTEEAIARHKRSKKSFCLLLTDIDHFKNVNDTHGHPAGDEVLRQFASTFKSVLRETDTPCRYGGEEFAILLEETDTEGAILIGNKIREAVKALQFESEAGTFNCSLSIGVATWPEDATEKQGLIDLADKALYFSKEHGRDRVTPVKEL